MMIDVALKITALFCAAWTISFALRGRAASTRHAVWTGILAAALALPLFGAIAPAVEVAWLPASPAAAPQPIAAVENNARPVATPRADAMPDAGAQRARQPVTQAKPSPSAPPAAPRRASMSPAHALAAAWFLITALFAVRTIRAHRQAHRLLHACVDAPAPLHDVLADVAAELQVKTPPLRLAPAGTMPAVIGVVRPSVVLPADATRWTAARLRLVLLHECAHVRRRDALLQVIANAATAVYWWHPLSWLAARRIVRERELACDDLVIASGTAGSDYAAHLIDIARAMKPSGQQALAALAMARPSELEGRLIALLEERPRHTRPARALALGAGLALVALVMIAPIKLIARDAAIAPSLQAQAPSPTPAEPVDELDDLIDGESADNPIDGAFEDAMPEPDADARSAPQADAQAAPSSSMKDALANALRRALGDTDRDVRMMALGALTRQNDAAVVPVLVQALNDEDDDMQAFALLKLIALEREEARAFLPRALADNADDVRAVGVIGLKKLGHPNRRALLLTTAGDPSDDVRALTAVMLGDESGDDVDAMLIRLSEDPSSDVRGAALFAIARRAGYDVARRDFPLGLAITEGIVEGIAEGVGHGLAGGIASGIVRGVAGGVNGGIVRR